MKEHLYCILGIVLLRTVIFCGASIEAEEVEGTKRGGRGRGHMDCGDRGREGGEGGNVGGDGDVGGLDVVEFRPRQPKAFFCSVLRSCTQGQEAGSYEFSS